jgi:hypothetical protein
VGLTVMVKVMGTPVQPLALGVTVMVAVTGAAPAFVALKPAILPLPLAAKPMVVLLFVQLYVVPATVPEKLMGTVWIPLHKDWLSTAFTTGVGFTKMVKVMGAPGQPLALGVTVMVAVTGALVVLVALKLAMLPFPLAARPMDGVLFVQLYVVPATGPLKLTAVVGLPLHNTWLATAFATGVGFTVIVKVRTGPGQPLALGVTVMVAVIGALVVLVAVKLAILPFPLAAKPMDVVLFVQL